MILEPVVLEGRFVTLRPLRPEDTPHLAAVSDPSLWQWHPQWNVHNEKDMKGFVAQAVANTAGGTELAFTVLDKPSGRIVGTTRFMNVDSANLRVEIGATWYAQDVQGTKVNPESKYLLLKHAFERWDCRRVEFKTDSLNARSRRAILKLGAKEEGTLRNHMITYSGRLRHTVYFSVIDSEWPAVKLGLETRLDG